MKRVCDVFGTSREVRTFAIYLQPLDAEGKNDGQATKIAQPDLSPRAIPRLEKFIKRGSSAPPPRK